MVYNGHTFLIIFMIIVESSRGYEITFEFRPNITKDVKAIPGARWMGKEKGWFVPVIADIKRPDQQNIKIYTKPYIEDIRLKYVKITAGAGDPEKYLTIPDLPELTITLPTKKPLYPYQGNGVARGMELERFINGDQPGLGKSFQAIGTVLGWEVTGLEVFPCLVICPSSLRENWRREWEEKFTHKKAMVLSDSNKHNWHHYFNMRMADVFIVNYESLKKYFVIGTTNKKGQPLTLEHIQFNPVKDLIKSVVIDELHRLKDPGTLQSKFTRGITYGKRYVIGLTGTPIVNKPKDLISQLAIINRMKDFGGYKFFLDRYCQGGSGAANLTELNGKLNNICFFRREKKDVLKDLPDKMREIILCDITNRDEYSVAVNNFVKYLTEAGYTQKEMDKSLKAEALVKIGLLKGIAARGKLEMMTEKIQEIIDAGQKVVVFIHQKFMAEHFLRAFHGSVAVRGMEKDLITGKEKSQSAVARQLAVDTFQGCKICRVNFENHDDQNHEYVHGDCKLIVCSLQAGGVGLTLTSSYTLMFGELPWHAASTDQCEDRIHRISQKNAAQIMYFLGKDTIDVDIYKTIEKKREISDVITGNTDEIDTMINDLTRNLFNQKAR